MNGTSSGYSRVRDELGGRPQGLFSYGWDAVRAGAPAGAYFALQGREDLAWNEQITRWSVTEDGHGFEIVSGDTPNRAIFQSRRNEHQIDLRTTEQAFEQFERKRSRR